MASRYGLRSKETSSPAIGIKSPSKVLAEQLSSISVSDAAEKAKEKKLRSAFSLGRKSLKENFTAFGNGGSSSFTPVVTSGSERKRTSPLIEEEKATEKPKGKKAGGNAKIALASASTGRNSVSPNVQKNEEVSAKYRDAMLPSFTSFGRRKTAVVAASKRRTKKLILDAVVNPEEQENEENTAAARQATNKLPPLDLSWLNIDDLQDLIVSELENRRIVSEQLMRRYRRDFSQWVVQLLSGFNILLHGLGSKRGVLTEFCNEKLIPGGFNVAEFDCWRPDFSFSDFVKELFFGYCRQPESTKLTDAEMIGRVESYLESSLSHLVLLLHSIDGVEVRGNRKFHSTLSLLAKLERVHVVASADHVNFSLMWDTATVENFNWIYMEAPTFEPPVIESRSNDCSLLRSILRAHSTTGAHVTLTSVRHVVFSLTPNAIKMFIMICYIFVEKQARRTAAKKAAKSSKAARAAKAETGDGDEFTVVDLTSVVDLLLPLSVLYKHCRDQFIVSSFELMLKHLRELYDHTLAKQVKHPDDGVDCLQLNMPGEIATSFLDECRAGEFSQFLESLSTDIELG